MDISRRDYLRTSAILPALAVPSGWTREWDQVLLSSAAEAAGRSYDAAERMLAVSIGAEYHYHTNLRNTRAHPTRESLDYALTLLEAGGRENARRAAGIIDRVVAVQETDPDSKWYGIWGYYLEEPAPKMSPADWNWADFNGSLLLLIEYRHAARLPGALRRRVGEAIRHAAYSVRRRNVTMTYTNIAIQGTFVTLAAAELLGDSDLAAYASDRLRRFARTVDETGSFAEFNSPTYANVSVANLTRIRMLVKDRESLALADRIHFRAWLHLASHWHAPTRQLAGPMSRAYSTDIGAPLWIQKALGNRLVFATLEQLRARRERGGAETAMLDYQCPYELAPKFLSLAEPRQHREIFLPPEGTAPPVAGVTWLDRTFTLGSVNRLDLWVQRRPLVAYWKGPGRDRPARYVQLRFMEDDYDFASALFYSVQQKGFCLAAVNFRNPGGDKHISLDPITNGEFQASRLRLRFDIAGVEAPVMLAAGKPVDVAAGEFQAGTAFAFDLGGAKLWLASAYAAFGPHTPQWVVAREDGMWTVSLDLFRSPTPAAVRWSEAGDACAVFAVGMDGPAGSLAAFDARLRSVVFRATAETGLVRSSWDSPAGVLALQAATRPADVATQNRAFSERLRSRPVPHTRLSEERLV